MASASAPRTSPKLQLKHPARKVCFYSFCCCLSLNLLLSTAQIAAANLAGTNRGVNGPPRPRKTVTPRPPVSSVSDALVSFIFRFIYVALSPCQAKRARIEPEDAESDDGVEIFFDKSVEQAKAPLTPRGSVTPPSAKVNTTRFFL
jgi:hypothetical protein